MIKFNLFIALLYSTFIFYFGLSESDIISINHFNINDKLAHTVSYLFFCLIWYKNFSIWFKNNTLIYLFLFSLSFGILIEFGQKHLTYSRNLELLDIVFNLIGILIVHIFFYLKKRNI